MSWTSVSLWLPDLGLTLFFFAVGASMGSLINVLAYRIPQGLSVITPPSRCPSCDTRLTWRENIPIFGWVLLGGKCRFCKKPISVEYPIVEALVACLFALFFAVWYVAKPQTEVLGIQIGVVKPEWALNGLLTTWPVFVTLLFLLVGLVSMTIIDARTYTIPLVLAWVPTVAAFVILPAHAAWFGLDHGALEEFRPGYWVAADGQRWHSAAGWLWTLATPSVGNWPVILAGIGGVLGIGVSLLLQKLGLIRHSFADYEAWEKRALAEAAEREGNAEEPDGRESDTLGESAGEGTLAGASGSSGEGGAGSSDGAAPHDDAAQLWIQYPHARREMFIESAFIAPIVLLAVAGAWLGRTVALPDAAPLWLTVLGGVCLGYLVGGGVVWAVRIFGSLLFGKEAMGIGDVHLMAAVGACLGWPDAVLGFFGAAFVGLAYAVAGAIVGGRMRRAMPFGPFLAVATVLVLLTKPAIEMGLARVFVSAGSIDLP